MLGDPKGLAVLGGVPGHDPPKEPIRQALLKLKSFW
jgi:hypothetical protein